MSQHLTRTGDAFCLGQHRQIAMSTNCHTVCLPESTVCRTVVRKGSPTVKLDPPATLGDTDA